MSEILPFTSTAGIFLSRAWQIIFGQSSVSKITSAEGRHACTESGAHTISHGARTFTVLSDDTDTTRDADKNLTCPIASAWPLIVIKSSPF